MAKTGLGIKRTCLSCNTRFYDFDRSPIICPGCGAEYDPKDLVKIQKNHRASRAETMAAEKTIELDARVDQDPSTDMVFDEVDVDLDDKDGPGVIEDDISDGDELLPTLDEKDD